VLADSVLVSTTSSVLRIEAAAAVPEVDSSCDVDISTPMAMALSTVLRMLELAFSNDVLDMLLDEIGLTLELVDLACDVVGILEVCTMTFDDMTIDPVIVTGALLVLG